MRIIKRKLGFSKGLKLLGFAFISLVNLPALAAPPSEIQSLTVAFLYNFMKLSEWPTESGATGLTLCVIQAGEYVIDIDSLAGKEVQNHTLEIKHLMQGDSVIGCQLVYIPENEKPIRIREWLSSMKHQPILSVSGTPGFLEQGGMIELISDGTHLQFEVNLEPVTQVGIKLSSKMLQIAREVKGTPE